MLYLQSQGAFWAGQYLGAVVRRLVPGWPLGRIHESVNCTSSSRQVQEHVTFNPQKITSQIRGNQEENLPAQQHADRLPQKSQNWSHTSKLDALIRSQAPSLPQLTSLKRLGGRCSWASYVRPTCDHLVTEALKTATLVETEPGGLATHMLTDKHPAPPVTGHC